MSGSKIIFINPPIEKEKYRFFKYFYKPFHPISLIYVASAVRGRGYSVRFIDMEAENLAVKDVVNIIKKVQPDLIAIGVLTPSAQIVEEICIETRRVSKNTKIITGNLHASFMADKWIFEGICDYVVHGEGEETTPLLIEAIDFRKDISSIPSISYFEGGKVISTPRGSPPINLDNLPFPDWSLVRLNRYEMNFLVKTGKVGVPIFNARGCPYNCTFCAFDKYARLPRYRSPENVLEEIRMLIHNYKIDHIWFLEPNFAINRRITEQLLLSLIKYGIHKKIKWVCGMRVDSIEPDIIKLMKEAGCERIYLGFESGVNALLEDINKGTDIDSGKAAAKMIKDKGIKVAGLFMIGLPNEKREDTERTIQYACNLGLDFAKFAVTVPFPGSPLFNNLFQKGEIKRPDWGNYLTFSLSPEYLINIDKYQSNSDIVKQLIFSHLRFYLRPKQIISILKYLMEGTFKKIE